VQISVRQPDKSGETSFFATFNRQGLDNSPFIRQDRNGVLDQGIHNEYAITVRSKDS
jgi:hypothetical protein